MSKRRSHDAWGKARLALEAVTGARTVSELAAEYGADPGTIHRWSEPWSAPGPGTMARALLEGASDIFERGGKKKPGLDEETVRSLHARIGELAVANDFSPRKLEPWTGE